MSELTSADFNNDGYPDFATFSVDDGKVSVFINNLNDGFNQPTEVPVLYGYYGISSRGIAAGDLNNDGKIDLLSSGVVLLND